MRFILLHKITFVYTRIRYKEYLLKWKILFILIYIVITHMK